MQTGGRLLTPRSEVVLKKAKFPSRNPSERLGKSRDLHVFFCHVYALPPSASDSSTPSKTQLCSPANQPSRNFKNNAWSRVPSPRTHEQESHVPPIISGSLMLNSLVVINGGQIPGCSGQTKSPKLSQAPPQWEKTEVVFLLGWSLRLMHLAARTSLGRGQPQRALDQKDTMLLK